MIFEHLMKSISLFYSEGNVFEIRATECWDRSPEWSSVRYGYFDDPKKAVECVSKLESSWNPEAIYITLNPVLPDLLARSSNQIKKGKKGSTTSDNEIAFRQWLFFDFDPDRPHGVSATNEELELAKLAAQECGKWLVENGFPLPVIGMSGNGYHLLFKLNNLKVDDQRIEKCIKALSARFSTDKVKIDEKVFNPARIIKLYWTLARKGDSTESRPHRRSEIVEVPETIECISDDRLDWLAAQFTEKNHKSTGLSLSSYSNRIDTIERARKYLAAIPFAVSESGGGSHTFLTAGHLTRGFELSDSEAFDLLSQWNVGCIPPWTDAELRHKIESSRAQCKVVEVGQHLKPMQRDETPVDISAIVSSPGSVITKHNDQEPINPDAIPSLLYKIPGLIGDMIAYHVYNAPRPRPELSLAASIALMGAITGRKIQTKSGMRTNIYCVGLAPSGSGKEQPRQNNTMALIEAGIPNLLGSENPASDAALVGELAEHPTKLIQIDEVSRYFSTLKNAGNNSIHLKNIFTRFLELTGQAQNPAWTPKGYADGKKSKTICHPHLCIYGTSTSEGFWSSVASSDAVDGFLARMMVVEADNKYPRLQDVETSPIPQTIIDILKDWDSFSPPAYGNVSDQFPRAMTVHVESAAADRIKSHSDGIEDRLNDGPDDQKAIWSRASALAKRLSLIFAASRGPYEILVTLEDAQLAVKLSNWCTRLLVRRVFTHVSANEADSDKKKVLEIIRRHREITANELTRKTQWIRNRRTRTEVLDELVDGGFILRTYRDVTEAGGRRAEVFVLV